jgi:hypothetical protein
MEALKQWQLIHFKMLGATTWCIAIAAYLQMEFSRKIKINCLQETKKFIFQLYSVSNSNDNFIIYLNIMNTVNNKSSEPTTNITNTQANG